MTAEKTAGQIGADLNDELTIILNCLAELERGLEAGHAAREWLALERAAVQRLAWKASALVTMGGAWRGPERGASAAVRIPEAAGLFHPMTIEAMLRRLHDNPKERV
jgi:hypothetical protein